MRLWHARFRIAYARDDRRSAEVSLSSTTGSRPNTDMSAASGGIAGRENLAETHLGESALGEDNQEAGFAACTVTDNDELAPDFRHGESIDLENRVHVSSKSMPNARSRCAGRCRRVGRGGDKRREARAEAAGVANEPRESVRVSNGALHTSVSPSSP